MKRSFQNIYDAIKTTTTKKSSVSYYLILICLLLYLYSTSSFSRCHLNSHHNHFQGASIFSRQNMNIQKQFSKLAQTHSLSGFGYGQCQRSREKKRATQSYRVHRAPLMMLTIINYDEMAYNTHLYHTYTYTIYG